MKFWGSVGLVLLAIAAFWVGQRLSADAVSMAVGMIFGVLAGIPAALLVLVAGRRRQDDAFDDEEEEMDGAGRRGRYASPYSALPPQAPVIIFAPPPAHAPYGSEPSGASYANGGYAVQPLLHQRALPAPDPRTIDGGRAFKVVGEQEEWLTEW